MVSVVYGFSVLAGIFATRQYTKVFFSPAKRARVKVWALQISGFVKSLNFPEFFLDK
jgi:hypothetical protein